MEGVEVAADDQHAVRMDRHDPLRTVLDLAADPASLLMGEERRQAAVFLVLDADAVELVMFTCESDHSAIAR